MEKTDRYYLNQVFILSGTRPVSREREKRSSSRLHRGLPTSTEIPRDQGRMPNNPVQSSMIPIAQINSGLRRSSASKDETTGRSASSRHLRK